MSAAFLAKKHKVCQLISMFVLLGGIPLFLPILTYAQDATSVGGYARLQTHEISRKGKYYSRQSATVDTQKPYRVAPGFTFTSLGLRIGRSENFTDAYVIAGTDTFRLQHAECRPDAHQPEEDTLKQSNLIIFDKPQKRVLFVPGTIRGGIAFSFINAGTRNNQKIFSPQSKQQALHDSCAKPTVVAQSTWRNGLPAPSYRRISTDVAHIIVHHAATYNDLTDYASVVKNIYLFHTMDRGWSDIGYNYLIAQDGTIFEGRSTGGQNVETDNIQGAHFCGKNSGTMGICMLGNYETALPTETSIASLKNLIAWKVNKDALDPLAERYHPANPSLGTIAGHHNGCSTECPGDNLYAQLNEIRISVAERIAKICDPVVLKVYADPASNNLYIRTPDILAKQQVLIYNMQGQQMEVPLRLDQKNDQWIADFTWLAAGVYIVKVQSESFIASRKVLLLHSS